MENVWFTADLHFMHKSILEHCPNRIDELKKHYTSDDITLKMHDDFFINLWNITVNKKDRVYVLGDFSFGNSEETRKILSKLNGEKHLILGNHDKSSEKLTSYFKSISQIKEVRFKKENYNFLDEDLKIICCHYPMVSWKDLNEGACHIHGHCHGRIDWMNDLSLEMRVDVGIDGKLANFGLISLEKLYEHFKNIKKITNSMRNNAENECHELKKIEK